MADTSNKPMFLDDELFLFALGFGVGIYGFFKGFRTFRKYRVLADTPEMPIRSIPMGLVQVHGQAKGEERVVSPVTHTPCFFYKVDIERWKTDSKGQGSWSHDTTDAGGVKFYLEDGTGKVLIDPYNAEYDLAENGKREVSGTGTQSVQRGASFAAGSGVRDFDLRSYVTQAHARRFANFTEHLLTAVGPRANPEHERARQAAFSALELFKTPGTTPGQFPESFQHFLTAEGPLSDPEQERKRLAALQSLERLAQSEMARANEPASGRYRLTEYCILPDHTYDVTGACVENANPKDEHDRNLIRKGQNEPTFLISWRSERELEQALRNRALLYIFGGAALSVVCMGILLAKLGWL